ncbi:DNA polymerase III, delta' subunit [Bordetella bronchiseptica Bbr77]|nr:DNA polymerase III, delta' subunit [Bordetella bronchiseptica Bbr77]
MSLGRFLPWQTEIARSWLSERDRFAHAWLIHGNGGIGKLDFAAAAAASLLCESPRQGLACGECAACAWVASGNHPDLRRIRPEAVALEEGADQAEGAEEAEAGSGGGAAKRAPSKDIRIDQIRALEPWFNTATHRGGWRVALLYPAHALNVISANALLKVLEEPPAHTVFLLVADAPDAQRLAARGDAPCPAWLAQLVQPLAAGKAPDVGTLTENLEKVAAAEWIDALQRLFTDLTLAAHGAASRYYPSLAEPVRQAAARAQPAQLAETARWLSRQRGLATHPLNAKLFVHAALQRVVLSCQ